MSDLKPLITASGISLRVPVIRPNERSLLANPGRLFSDLYLARRERGFVTILNNVSFTLRPGERLGVVGPNGAGKSTLLRVLAKIYTPSSGILETRGGVKGLFDVSLGMLPQATGMENIILRGLQDGFSLSEIRERAAEVIDFSELKDHIEKPLSTYSTGMRLRLAVSISTMIDPDILLLDEWIGTGDANFAKKIRKRIIKMIDGEKGFILATHNMDLMKQLCTHVITIDNGSVTSHSKI